MTRGAADGLSVALRPAIVIERDEVYLGTARCRVTDQVADSWECLEHDRSILVCLNRRITREREWLLELLAAARDPTPAPLGRNVSPGDRGVRGVVVARDRVRGLARVAAAMTAEKR